MMIKLLEVNSSPAAQLFASYCQSQQLLVSVVVHSQEHAELWCEEGSASKLNALWLEFIDNPEHPRYQDAAWQQASLSKGASSGTGFSGYWRQLWSHAGIVTHSIWLMAILVFCWQQVAPWQALSALQLQGQSTLLEQGYRWLSPAWLHFSPAHLIFNLIWVWYLSGTIEKRSGKLVVLLLLLVTLLLSHVLQYLMVGPNFGGLSGFVYGLFGFYWICGWLRPTWGYQLSRGLVGFMLLWLVVGFADVLFIPMANWAHLGGLLGGIGFALLLCLTGRR